MVKETKAVDIEAEPKSAEDGRRRTQSTGCSRTRRNEIEAAEVTEIPKAAEVDVSAEPEETVDGERN